MFQGHLQSFAGVYFDFWEKFAKIDLNRIIRQRIFRFLKYEFFESIGCKYNRGFTTVFWENSHSDRLIEMRTGCLSILMFLTPLAEVTLILQAPLKVTVFVKCLVRDFGIWAFYYTCQAVQKSISKVRDSEAHSHHQSHHPQKKVLE